MFGLYYKNDVPVFTSNSKLLLFKVRRLLRNAFEHLRYQNFKVKRVHTIEEEIQLQTYIKELSDLHHKSVVILLDPQSSELEVLNVKSCFKVPDNIYAIRNYICLVAQIEILDFMLSAYNLNNIKKDIQTLHLLEVVDSKPTNAYLMENLGMRMERYKRVIQSDYIINT